MLLFRDINWGTVAITVGIMVGIAILLGVAIMLVSKAFFVAKDERIDQIVDNLAKANCGACGYPGCGGYAEALLKGEADLSACGATSAAGKAEIAKILGQEFAGGEPTVAVVACCGGDKAEDKYTHVGYENCETQAMLGGGRKVCPSGCMGECSCGAVCPQVAIIKKDGYAAVDPALCISCGLCAKTCPKGLIKFIPQSAKVFVACSSTCKGKDVMSACKVGCIGCGLCARNCPNGAITMANNLPVIDYSKCNGCKVCVSKCPRKTIVDREA